MIGNAYAYPEYKESGVPWLGRIPVNWYLAPLKRLAIFRKGRPPSYLSVPRPSSPSALPYLSMDYLRSRMSGEVQYGVPSVDTVIAKKGDLLLLWDGANAGEFLIAKHGIVSSTSALVESRSLDPHFLYYACKVVEPALRSRTVGMGIPHVNPVFLGQLLLPVPSKPVQRRIAAAIAYCNERFLRLTDSRQLEVERLREFLKQAIWHAVTHGLDSGVSFKRSGIDWIDEIPAHWEARRNGRLFVQRKEHGSSGLPILEVSLQTGIRVRDLQNLKRKQRMDDLTKYKRAAKNDLAYNMMRMWQGAVGAVPVDGLVSPSYVVASPSPGVHAPYYAYLFRTDVYVNQSYRYSRGIVPDRDRLYWDDFRRMPSLVPPLAEQTQIAYFLDRLSATTERLVSIYRTEVRLMREYRNRLVYELVTGKLDARGINSHFNEETGPVELLEAHEEDDEADGGGEVANTNLVWGLDATK